MPDGVGQVGPTANVQRVGGQEDTSWIDGLKMALQFVVRKLQASFATQQQSTQTPAVASRAAVAAPAAAAPAAVAATAVPSPTQLGPVDGAADTTRPPFDASAWLTKECKKITADLAEKTDEGKINLKNLYNSAEKLKESFVANLVNLRTSLPEDLRADFDTNIAIIENCFNDPADTRDISQNEICFLHACINFLKTSVGRTSKELSDSLSKLNSVLDEAVNQIKHDIEDAEESLTEKITEATELRKQAEDAQDQLHIAQQAFATHRTTATRNARNVRRAEANNAIRPLQAADIEVISARSKLEDSRKSSHEKRIETLGGELAQLRVERTALRSARQSLRLANPADPRIPIHDQQIKAKDIQVREKIIATQTARNDLRIDNEIPRNTSNLIMRTQERQIGSFAPDTLVTFEEHMIQRTERKFKDIACLARATKKPDAVWLGLVQHFERQLEDLNTQRNTPISVPDTFPANAAPEGDHQYACQLIEQIAGTPQGQKPKTLPVFEHARQIAGNPGVRAASTHNEKRLAMMSLGSFCAAQAVKNSDDVIHGKASLLIESSAQLLAAPLTLRAAKQPRATPAAPHALQKTLIKYCQKSKMNDLGSILNAEPGSTTDEGIETIFNRGVLLEVATRDSKEISDVKALFAQATTNRTYQNDRTVFDGESRQDVFKKSMLRAAEFIKDPPAANAPANGARGNIFAQVGGVVLNQQNDDVLMLLGLDDTANPSVSHEFIDQMVLASIAQNDLSTDAKHVSRGSLVAHIDKFDQNPTRGRLKNHDLTNYKMLSDLLTNTAIQIRVQVEHRIDDMKAQLLTTNPIGKQEIDQLVKQIIITTDAKSACHNDFDLKRLVKSAEKLRGSNDTADRNAFSEALGMVQRVWGETKGGPTGVVQASQWTVEDQRTKLQKALKSNPVRSLPFVNRLPVIPRCAAAASVVAKALFAGVGTAAVVAAFIPVAAVAATLIISADVGLRAARQTF